MEVMALGVREKDVDDSCAFGSDCGERGHGDGGCRKLHPGDKGYVAAVSTTVVVVVYGDGGSSSSSCCCCCCCC